MRDECDENTHMNDLGSFDNIISNNQVLSNLRVAWQDRPHVLSRGRPKSLRQKHLKENQPHVLAIKF